jgi:hypothetical protein
MQRIIQFCNTNSTVQHTSIVGGADNIVIPRVFATRSGDVVHIPDTGHVGMLFSPRVFREVCNRLNADASHDFSKRHNSSEQRSHVRRDIRV